MRSGRKLFHYTIEDYDPMSVFAALHPLPYSLFFDSSDSEHTLSQYSFVAFHPFETIESKNGKITVTNREQQLSFIGDPLKAVKDRMKIYGEFIQTHEHLPPFQGGAAGYFGYDLGRSLEDLPEIAQDRDAVPDMALGLYDQVYAYDHKKEKGSLIIQAETESDAAEKHQRFIRLIAEPVAQPAQEYFRPEWRSTHTKKQYERAVQTVIDYIYAGDIFQANMSQRFEADLPQHFNSYTHYCTLREVNAAPFGAYMNFGNITISSSSPERFIKVSGRHVETRPIKGTSPRMGEEAIDQFHRNKLENSEKDRAENVMIVDLLRNDLSKVCEDHSIKVSQLCALESFASVHHLVSIVEGTLRANQSSLAMLRCAFPGGSITGAPKVRAMEIIEELEPVRRGPYCGSMGYIGFDGTMDCNIAIRTLVYEGNSVSFNVGGGVVAASKPEDEYQETLNKAAGIFESFEVYAAKQGVA